MRILSSKLLATLLFTLALGACQPHGEHTIISKLQSPQELEVEAIEAVDETPSYTDNNPVCATADSLEACDVLTDICQPVYLDHADEESDASFSQCIAKIHPDLFAPVEVSVKLVTIQAVEQLPPEPEEAGRPSTSSILDTIKEMAPESCSEADPKYLVGKKKIMICHQTENGTHHTIVVACRTLWSHSLNHKDYLGACY
ncbi:MAG TPA: hypothetical protein VNJ01_03435 [Bacteriovoracaceae bacterium]|nr:hypothetical protein [Bacteriovoracaceae bacterium]